MEPSLCNYDNSGHMRYFPFAVSSKWLLYEHKLKLHSFAVYKKQALEGTTSSFSLLINFYEQLPFFKATLYTLCKILLCPESLGSNHP